MKAWTPARAHPDHPLTSGFDDTPSLDTGGTHPAGAYRATLTHADPLQIGQKPTPVDSRRVQAYAALLLLESASHDAVTRARALAANGTYLRHVSSLSLESVAI